MSDLNIRCAFQSGMRLRPTAAEVAEPWQCTEDKYPLGH